MTRRSCDDLVEAVEARVQYRHRTCCECGGTMKVIACIENPVVIEKILAHLQGKDTSVPTSLRPASRAQPADLFG